MMAASSASNQGISWGGMIVGAAKITAAVTVITVCSWFLSGFIGNIWDEQLSPDFKDWVRDTAKDAKGLAVDAWDSVLTFFNDLASDKPNKSKSAQFVEDAWKSDWVKGGALVAGLGVVGLGANKLYHSMKSDPAPNDIRIAPRDESHVYRELKRRMDHIRATDMAR